MNPICVFDHSAGRRTSRALLILALAGLAAGACLGQGAEDLRITVGKSIVIDYPSDIRQISTSNPDVVDANPVTTREILMHGKGIGSATLVVWSKTDQRMFYNVTVDLNTENLKRILRETFPNERIEVRNSGDSISLNGVVSSKEVAERAAALAGVVAKVDVAGRCAQLPGDRLEFIGLVGKRWQGPRDLRPVDARALPDVAVAAGDGDEGLCAAFGQRLRPLRRIEHRIAESRQWLGAQVTAGHLSGYLAQGLKARKRRKNTHCLTLDEPRGVPV